MSPALRPSATIRAIRISPHNYCASRVPIPMVLLVYAFAQEAGIIVRQAKRARLDVEAVRGWRHVDPAVAAGRREGGDRFRFGPRRAGNPGNSDDTERRRLPREAESGLLPGRFSARPAVGIRHWPPMRRPRSPRPRSRRSAAIVTREAFVDALESMKNFDSGVTFPSATARTITKAREQVEIDPSRTRPEMGEPWRSETRS